MIRRIKVWNAWRRNTQVFTSWEKFLVLIGVHHSWSFEWDLYFYEEDQS